MLTESECKALVAAALLVLLAAIARLILEPAPRPVVAGDGLVPAGDVDSALVVADSLYELRERRGSPLRPGERLDPNRASEVELDRLPGIGPELARAIAESRRRQGPFRTLADLERVSGLGSKRLSRLAPFLAMPESLGARPPHAAAVKALGPAPAVGPAARLDLNRASQAELEKLPGVGPARARAIVRWRSEQGGFDSWEEVLRVPGIGPVTLARLRARTIVRP